MIYIIEKVCRRKTHSNRTKVRGRV